MLIFIIAYQRYYIPNIGLLYVENKKERCKNIYPIDVVYTWVDSSDPEWKKSILKYTPESKVKNNIRFPDEQNPDLELETSLMLLFNHAGHIIRNVYIVTADKQIPKCIYKQYFKNKSIHVVHHSEIWKKDLVKELPVFNSISIECNLHRIPGLSELFIYFNDDVYLTKKLNINNYFCNNKIIVQNMKKTKPLTAKCTHSVIYKNLIEKFYPMRQLWHGFHCLSKTACIEAENDIKYNWINDTIKSKFRNGKNIPFIGYVVNYALKNNLAYRAPNPLKLLNIRSNLDYTKEKYNKESDYDVICINNGMKITDSIEKLKNIYLY